MKEVAQRGRGNCNLTLILRCHLITLCIAVPLFTLPDSVAADGASNPVSEYADREIRAYILCVRDNALQLTAGNSDNAEVVDEAVERCEQERRSIAERLSEPPLNYTTEEANLAAELIKTKVAIPSTMRLLREKQQQ